MRPEPDHSRPGAGFLVRLGRSGSTPAEGQFMDMSLAACI